MTNVAIIGTGFIGPVHVEALRRIGIQVVGVLGSSPDKSAVAARLLGIERAYTELQEIVTDPTVDSVHITSPNQAHFDQAIACLRAGKHVLCEKPLAMNSEESSQLVQFAKQSGVAAGVNYNIRYYPLCIEARERRKQNLLGSVHHVAGCYVQDWLFHRHDYNWRVSSARGGPLRAVADIGTHWLDLVRSITGLEVESVCADLQTVFPSRLQARGPTETFSSNRPSDSREVRVDTEDFGSVLLRFRKQAEDETAARGVLWVSQVTAGRKNSLKWEVAGSKQALSWNSECPNQLWVGHRDQPNEILTRDPALMDKNAAEFSSYPGGHNEGFSDTFKQLFRDFYACIERGEFQPENATFPTFEDGHREILLCEAILKSASERRWVNLDEPAG